MTLEIGSHTRSRMSSRDITQFVKPSEITRRIESVQPLLGRGETHVIVARLPFVVTASDGSTGNMIVVPVHSDRPGHMFAKTIMFRHSNQPKIKRTIDASSR